MINNLDNLERTLDILSKVRQGKDTCMLQATCIPIITENPDPALLIFPRCYEINRCIGSCCDFTEGCLPTGIKYIQKPVTFLHYHFI